MKKVLDNYVHNENQKKGLLWVWENQHPLMYVWFALTSVSLFSVYILSFTKL